ncbi:MAG: carbonic anhydrase [Anaerolineae bacterium]|nr:carbonic anhydrase [Anaerolineae bacterium]
MSHHNANLPSPNEALQMLKNGNQRYVEAQLTHPDQTPQRRTDLSGGQSPFAIVLGCADSRVPPEIVFDQGLGNIFTIRVAGNVIDDIVLGSIEYAAEHLHTPLMVVLGHSNCGAVAATLAGGELGGHLPSLAEAIQPAVNMAKDQAGDVLDNAVRINAKMMAEHLRQSEPILAKLVNSGQFKVVAARYDLASGVVDFLD